MAPPTAKANRSRNRTLALAGSLVALGGLGYYLYNFWSHTQTLPSSSRQADDERNRGKRVSLTETNRLRLTSFWQNIRPSLSLSIAPNFVRSSGNIHLLAQLLRDLSQDFTVTLIAPPPAHVRKLHDGHSVTTSPDREDYGVHSVALLADQLQGIDGFDPRRTLEYSKEDGRQSLARALACDAHCEVMFQSIDVASDALFEDERGDEDGDLTPRASSPVSQQHLKNHTHLFMNGFSAPPSHNAERQATLLEKYHADVARIRKSSNLVIFLILPVSQKGPSLTASSPSVDVEDNSDQSTIWTLDIESILKPFLLPGQKDLSSRVPGIKIIDSRIQGTQPTASNLSVAWTEGAKRLCHFASSWT